MISNLSEVPPHWIKVRFDEIAENITDRIEKPNDSGLEYYIGLEHLDTDQIRIKRFGSTEDVKATKFLCKKGDIIFGKRNAYLRKVAVTDRDAVVSAHSMVIRPIGDLIVPDFLPCFMQSSVFWKTAHAISEGSMSPTIKWRTLAKQEFWIPAIEEQKKIAEVLWAIEDNVEKNDRLLDINAIVKNSILNDLLTKGIGHKKLKKTEVGYIPEEWLTLPIKNLMTLEYGGNLPQRKRKEGPYPVLGSNGVVDSHNEYLIEGPSIIIGRKGTVGQVTYVQTNNWPIDTTFYVNINSEMLLMKYAYYLLANANLPILAQGAAVPGLNRNDVYAIKVPLPSKNEQAQIITFIEKFEKQKEKLLSNKDRLNVLKKKLTDEFLSGNLKIPLEALQNVQ